MRDMFDAKSIAVIGASETKGKIGYDIMRSLVNYYKGEIVPVNIKGGEILGIPACTSISEHGPVDLAVITIPSHLIPATVEECGEIGIKNIVVISAGFKEIDEEGARLENELVELCKKYKIKLVGPNCLGIMNTYNDMNASFSSDIAHKGKISFMSQSGAIMAAILDYADKKNIGFSRIVSLGNKAVINENDCMKDFMEDENTEVITAYLEGIVDGPGFIEASREASRKKPVLVIKSGRTSKGSEAVSSHTGTIAGSDSAYEAAFSQCGIIRVNSLDEMMDYSSALAFSPLPKGNRIVIITNAGGPAIMTTDVAIKNNLEIAELTCETKQKLKDGLPATASVKNPVDVLGDASPERYAFALETVLADPNVDGVIYLVTPQSVTDAEGIAKVAIEHAKSSEKPILCSFFGGTSFEGAEKLLAEHQIPNYLYPKRAVKSLKTLYNYSIIKDQEYPDSPDFDVDKEIVKNIIQEAQEKDMYTLGLESFDILKAYGIPTVGTAITKNLEDTLKAAEEIGYPLVMKIVSPQISHKSDVGGIKLNLNNADDVKAAYEDMMENIPKKEPNATLEGVQLQKMLSGGKEVIIGMVQDPTFGPMMMFGLGGIYVEILKDVKFAIAPVNEEEAREMIAGIKTHELLEGTRGDKAMDTEAIADIILRISQLVTDFPEINEFEINPLMVFEEGALAVDMRLMLKEGGSGPVSELSQSARVKSSE
ncbi:MULTISPECIES: acetate--CoA ligase family protein [Methanobacterium]|uniref:acetate--CoA ligase (ADP-forming) n=1 Tax=Methanobacterium veterum TaxID=408577 RepID=A0A9E5DPJ2_9EURY|nr:MULTISPECIES: acetate--CoA ligase [Methanobacterium]MCZ3367125.1 acetate--CoA ligase family protein [Methanobacterium veterum]MCZ3373727.1 acetate--CoA ligase family protein [Methanobacterium veterum]